MPPPFPTRMLCRWPTTRWFSAEGMRPKYPMVGSFAGCCARKQGDAGIRLVTGLICINNEISLKDDVAHGVQATRAKSLNPPGISTYSGTCVDNTQSYPPAESVGVHQIHIRNQDGDQSDRHDDRRSFSNNGRYGEPPLP